jgi:DNA-binding transcriptional regulator PaaX
MRAQRLKPGYVSNDKARARLRIKKFGPLGEKAELMLSKISDYVRRFIKPHSGSKDTAIDVVMWVVAVILGAQVGALAAIVWKLYGSSK